jgi:HEAT repeat protein
MAVLSLKIKLKNTPKAATPRLTMSISLKALRLLLFAGCFSLSAPAQTSAVQAPSAPAQPAQPDTTPEPTPQPTPKEQAWNLLRAGVRSEKNNQRATAVRALSLLRGQREAVTMARRALADKNPKVRAAAALALGELHASSAIPKLKEALSDKEVLVVLAAAHALLLLKDPSAYEVYYAILIGERKGSRALVSGGLDTLKDPKKMAMLGVQEGISFIPFGGIGFTAVQTIMKDDSSPVRAAAARVLAEDPDPKTTDGLAEEAVNDKSELVRTAALEAIALRGDPACIGKIAPAMSDAKDAVKYTAAATVAHLTAIAERRQVKKK